MTYGIILAVEAPQIAARDSEGIGFCAGQQVENRFFLDGVNMYGAGVRVRVVDERSLHVLPRAADPGFTFLKDAFMGAQFTGNRVFAHCLPVHRGLARIRRLGKTRRYGAHSEHCAGRLQDFSTGYHVILPVKT